MESHPGNSGVIHEHRADYVLPANEEAASAEFCRANASALDR
jgi:hypothetical protein